MMVAATIPSSDAGTGRTGLKKEVTVDVGALLGEAAHAPDLFLHETGKRLMAAVARRGGPCISHQILLGLRIGCSKFREMRWTKWFVHQATECHDELRS